MVKFSVVVIEVLIVLCYWDVIVLLLLDNECLVFLLLLLSYWRFSFVVVIELLKVKWRFFSYIVAWMIEDNVVLGIDKISLILWCCFYCVVVLNIGGLFI